MPFQGYRFFTGCALALLSVSLAACNKVGEDTGNASAAALPALPATLPMTDAPAQQTVLAPPPTAIPGARTIRTVRVADPRAAYAYADQAGYFSQSLGDGPPDYGFDYNGVSPWAWQGYDGSRVFIEPVGGGYRYYYYRAGADRPYFVRDPDYAYGYDGDQLAAVYAPDGALVPYGDYGPRADYAAAYLWRAQRLFEASRERQAISAAAWADRQDSIVAARERWAANRDRQADWAAYHADEAAQQSRYWAEEAERRDADEQRYAAWRQQDFHTPPPPRAIPPRWQQASWAQDGARYAPVAALAAGGVALAVAAHHRQAMMANSGASHQPALAAAPPRQPVTPPPAPLASRNTQEARPGLASRPQKRTPVRSSASPAERSGLTAENSGAARRPVEAVRPPVRPAPEIFNHEKPHPTRAAPDRPHRRPAEQTVTVHEGSEAASRSFAPTPHADEDHAAPSHADRIASPPPAPHRAPPPDRPPAAQPRPPQTAEQHGGGHPEGGHPGGGHPAGGDRR